ncbi:amino acid adenylation domain-containing protein [Dongshaea marina]|uniref:amino acid adenylation domain-containing protein n=1 Tax=Dongshaea marina TaxID=2047966 RepID=UPI000D3ED38C|nr:amino acid adenylation domain-containing protein [Dongshaea marina]
MASKKLIHDYFSNQANRTPDSIAIKSDKGHLTYRQLENRSNALAGYLIHHDVKPGEIIGVYLSRDIDLIITLLAILKAGACYLPLDPYYPQERLSYMVEHSGTALVITDKINEIDFGNDRCELLEFSEAELSRTNQTDIPTVDDDSLCYIMYTSGSTGTPKGVMVSHRTVVNYLEWMQYEFGISNNDVVLNQSSFSFDVSVWEIFWPLITGASCALISDDMKYDPDLLAEFIILHQVTVIQFVPTALRIIVEAKVLVDCHSLTHIFSGGESLEQKLVNELSYQFSGQIHNLYGPTEATIFACHWRCKSASNDIIVPIGKPIPHALSYILNDQLQQVPVGNRGELYLTGDILAKGYLKNEELTNERFVEDPFMGIENQKMYRTGDLVSQRVDGVLDFHGRIDSQIKFRGHRIELSEIESNLQSMPEITHAAVIAEYNEEKIISHLSAFYVLGQDKSLSPSEIKKYLSKILPFFMLPSNFVELASIPTLPNGKFDKSILSSYKNKGWDF